MGELKDTHDSIEEIPEPYRELYTEKGGKWELTGIQGVKTAADVARVQASLVKERDAHKATKDRLSAWGDMDHDDVLAKLDRLPELEAAAKGKLDDNAIEEIVTRRVEGTLKSKMTPLERELTKLKREREEIAEENQKFRTAEISRKVRDDVRSALVAAKVRPEAHEDALLLAERIMEITEEGQVQTRDGVGVVPGLDPGSWLTEIQDKRPHWWPGSVGGGARGSTEKGGFGGPNPWSAEGWNRTQQAQYIKAHGEEKATRMAQAAGTTMIGTRPKPRGASV